MARVMMGIAELPVTISGPGWCLVLLALPVTIPSTRNHLFILQVGIKIMLDIAGLPFNIPSIRNHFFPYSTSLTGPSSDYFIQQESSLSPPWPPKRGKFHTLWHWCPSDYSIHQELSLSLLYCVFNRAKITLGVVGLPRLIHPLGIFFFLLHGVFNRIMMTLGDAGFLHDFSIPQ